MIKFPYKIFTRFSAGFWPPRFTDLGEIILPRSLGISAAKILPRFRNLGGQNPAEISNLGG